MTTQIKFEVTCPDGTRLSTKINQIVAYANKKVNRPRWKDEATAIKWAKEFIEKGVRTIAGYSTAERVDSIE